MQGSPRIDELRQKFHENPRRYFAPLANEYRKAGDPEQAIAICRAHLAQQPQHMSGHVVYGQALYDARRTDEARTVFEKALSLDPDNTIVLRQLGDIAREKGEAAEARHWYGKALDLDPQDSEVAAYLAELAEPLVGVEQEGGTTTGTTEAGMSPVPAAADVTSPEALPEFADLENLDVLETAEADTEAGVAEATPPVEQGDGVEADLQEESRFVMSGAPSERSAEGEPEAETEEAQASDDGMPEPETVPEPEPPTEPEPSPELEPIAQPESESEREPEAAALSASREEDDGHAISDISEAVAASPEVPWRKTPQAVESPFVTRTMAELYVKQGYTEAALEVYRQLAIQHPDDVSIRERIEELSPSAAEPAAQESIYMPDTDFSQPPEGGTEPPVDAEGRHFSEISLGEQRPGLKRGAEIVGDAEERDALERDADIFGDGIERGAEIFGDGIERGAEIFGDAEERDEGKRDAEIPGHAEDEDWGGFGETLEAEIRAEDSPSELGDLSEAGAEEAFGERVAELDWTDPGFGFGAEEPESPEAEPVAEIEQREDETQEADEGTEIAGGARFVEMPVSLGEFQTSIDEAGMASTSPHESEIAPVIDPAPRTPATSDASVEADFRGDEAAAAMASGEAARTEPAVEGGAYEVEATAEVPAEVSLGEGIQAEDVPAEGELPQEVTPEDAPQEEEEAGVVAYSPEPPRDEDLPHFTPKVPTVREFFATLGARRPPREGDSTAFTARAVVPEVASQQQQPRAEDLPPAADALGSLFPDEEIAEEDTRAAFALSGAMSGTSHNPVPETIQMPPQQEPEKADSQTQESEEDIRRFREWLDGLADS